MELITGYKGAVHVTSEQAGAENAGIIGTGRYVFNQGLNFGYEIISNNLVRIKNGFGSNQGRIFGIIQSDYDELVIDNGAVGVNRKDLIVARYTKNAVSGLEEVSLVVIRGTAAVSPVDPSYTVGNILSGALLDDYPLFRVTITGLTITAVTPLFSLSKTIAELSVSNLLNSYGTSTTESMTQDFTTKYFNKNTYGVAQDGNGALVITGIDLNTLYKCGAYHCASCTNRPIALDGIIEVDVEVGGNGFQRYTVLSTGRIYQRMRVSGVWGSWIIIDSEYERKVLWVNSSPNSFMPATTLTLNENISNFKYYEVHYKQNISTDRTISTGMVYYTVSTVLQILNGYMYYRVIGAPDGISVVVNGGYYFGTYGNTSGTPANSHVIPTQIIGYRI